MKKVVIVGANHAGTAATNTILDNSKDHQVTVFDANSNISFLGCGMALWIGNQIDGPECQLPEKMLLKLLIMVNFRSFLRLLLKHFPDLTAG